jgi:GH25 family lysozyme M1 (1,4-beta-N-acetylmuramidase)
MDALKAWRVISVLTVVMLCLQMGTLILLPVAASASDPIVTFPDANLQAIIRTAIHKPTGDIHASDLTVLTNLTANHSGIVNLSGLESCTNLIYLDLWVNKISDIRPIAGLTKLNILYLAYNEISDLTPLTNLTNLAWLDLVSTKVSDIKPLVDNAGFATGDTVLLNGNPLNCIATGEEITALRSRGVTVIWDGSGSCCPKGLDVSTGSYSSTDNWTKVRDAGYKFAFVKATSGDQRPDPKTGKPYYNDHFRSQMEGAHDANIPAGAYHYAYPITNNAVDEANYFLSKAWDYLKIGYLRPSLDIEIDATSGDPLDKMGAKNLATWIDTWMTTVHDKTGVWPILYTRIDYISGSAYPENLTRYLNGKEYYDNSIWVPAYRCTTSCGQSPTPTQYPWKFWQYYSTDAPCCDKSITVPGIPSNVFDLNVFNGSEADLNKFVISASKGPPASVNTNQGTVNFTTSAGFITGLVNYPPDSMACSGSGLIFRFGMFAYDITNLNAGQTVTVTITTPINVPMGAKVYKCQYGGLTDFSTVSRQLDPHTFILTLTDGGQGDADGQKNGTIMDPCGIAEVESGISGISGISTRPPSSSGTVAAPTPQPPVNLSNIYVQSASLSSAKVGPGGLITVTADVANRGTANGSTLIKLYVNGQEEAHQGVTLSSGSRTPVKFTFSREEPGSYSVYVGGIPAGTFEVDQFADPNLILYISGALLFFVMVGGVIFMATRRRQR